MGRTGRGDETVTTAIVRAVADARGCELDELTPLYEAIDPDAVEELFGDGRLTDGRLVFGYEGYEVTVSGDGAVTIAESPNGADPTGDAHVNVSGESNV